jgi:LAS superfamily LD-carboxypeptidase LdcB
MNSFDKKPLLAYYLWVMRNMTRAVFPLSLGLIFLLGAFLPKEKIESDSQGSKITPDLSDNKVVTTAKGSKESLQNLLLTTEVKAKKASQISTGTIITYKGDNLLVLVNKHIRLPSSYEPKDLVGLEGKITVANSGLKLRREAADALAKMAKAAKAQGISLGVLSAYRSYWQQQNTFNYWVGKSGLQEAETFSARPGHSQHQLGTAVDFADGPTGQDLDQNFGATTKGTWLVDNAPRFGFVLSYPKGKEAITGYIYEPWHYRYIGVENTAKMIQAGLILEEFLQKFGVV